MAPKISDPLNFLTNLLTSKGKSDLHGIHLVGVSLLAEANQDYEYDVSQGLASSEVFQLLSRESVEWNELLVATRIDVHETVYPISFLRQREPITVYFLTEGIEMSAMVFIPTLTISEFATEVTFYQHLLREVALFAGKTPTSIRFTICAVSMEWDEVVERGCAREVDIGF